jgi:hypothetical protein
MKGRSSRRRRLRRVVVGAVALAGAASVAAPPSATVGAQDDDAQVLADRYAPIMMLRTQESDCDPDGEPFAPMSVDGLLDNPQILLRQVGRGDPVMMRAPGASDLADLGAGFYLDFPGDALRPGCLYEQDFARFSADQPAVVYAHVAHQADRPDRLALQYWLYWYYNDWNNKHESDWEFIQILFPAGSVADALQTDPISVGYAQHEGGERADWDDDKLERDGTHPVVYSSQRSHASYFAPALYLGRSASEGFGCDNTESPSTRVDPDVVVLPDQAGGPDDPLAWVGFDGRWGERHPVPNNGPTGPNTKPQWTEPVTWHDALRTTSFVVPTNNSRGNAVIDAFCGVVGWASVQLNRFFAEPWLMLAALALIAALAVFLVRRTSWDVVAPSPLARRRRIGEIMRLAGSTYRRHPGTFSAVGALAIPVALAALLVGSVVRRVPFIGDLVVVSDAEGGGGRFVISSMIAGLFTMFAFVVVSAAVAWLVGGPEGAGAGVGAAARAVGGRAGELASSFIPAAIAVVLLPLTVIGTPVAVWLFVRWQFLPQLTMLEAQAGRRALARSGQLTRRRWWRTALVVVIVTVVIGAAGVVVGLVLLITFTGLPLWALSAIVVACDVVVMPYGALVMTYLYGDAVAASVDATAAVEPAPALA